MGNSAEAKVENTKAMHLPNIYSLGIGHWRQGGGYGGCLGGHGEKCGHPQGHSGWYGLYKIIIFLQFTTSTRK